MPLYDYQCASCQNRQEAFFTIEAKPSSIECDLCDAPAFTVPCIGGIQGDEPSWLNDDLRGCLQKPGERPIEGRAEYKRYLREKNIVERG